MPGPRPCLCTRACSRDGFDLNALFKTGSDSVDVIARADNLAPGLRASISATLPDTQSGGAHAQHSDCTYTFFPIRPQCSRAHTDIA